MMKRDELLACVVESLTAISTPRFFQTERGYQGALLSQLDRRLQLPDYAIVEQEYQKQAGLHGVTIRPDIIIHEPFSPGRHGARTEGNLAVMELKLRATPAEALADFENLGLMLNKLSYQLGIFINIDSTSTHVDLVPAACRERIVCFAANIANGAVTVIK
jgi:hypothetical protein